MEDFSKRLNEIYFPLDKRRKELLSALKTGGFETECGYYNGHYHKNEGGNYVMDYYPIPVISVLGICDIEIEFEHIGFSTKLSHENALRYPFEKLGNYDFEAYGILDYLSDYYVKGNSVEDLKKNLSCCSEEEIGFSFSFDFNAFAEELLLFAKFLKSENFYY